MQDRAVIEYDTTPVRVRGEELREVLWRGRQWAVTTRGVEALDGTYRFDVSRLAADLPDWSWIRQLGEKTEWVDLADFTTAFMVALVLHGEADSVDPVLILQHYRKAKREAEPR